MGFEHPAAFLLLPLALLPWLPLRWRRRAALPLAVPPGLAAGRRSARVRLLWLPDALWALALAVTAVGAAGPYLDSGPDRRLGRDIAVVLDVSESMRAVDYELDGRRASRMDAARRFASEFIAGREGDRVAVVAFGSRAITQCPLTFDRDVAAALLGYLEPGMLGKRTALGEGLALATLRLTEGGGAAVLISDGENTAGDVRPEEAARAAARRGVRVYSVGVGSEGAAPVPVRLPSGRVVIRTKAYSLDEPMLRALAEATGGRYFRAADTDALPGVLEEIGRLERRAQVSRVARARHDWVTAMAAAACIVLACVLSATVLRTAPALR